MMHTFALAPMPDLQFCCLPDLSRPLLERFYRSHRSPMRRPAGAQAWVVRDPQIIAALCMTPVASGHWLTGLFVAPPRRDQGIARRLIEQASAACTGPVWLFCHPQLQDFYQPLGFAHATTLPAPLNERLLRYQQHKPLIALVRE